MGRRGRRIRTNHMMRRQRKTWNEEDGDHSHDEEGDIVSSRPLPFLLLALTHHPAMCVYCPSALIREDVGD
eukprot:429559-Pyramimonas_sp.AAC.1